jgi:hypothetical protein
MVVLHERVEFSHHVLRECDSERDYVYTRFGIAAYILLHELEQTLGFACAHVRLNIQATELLGVVTYFLIISITRHCHLLQVIWEFMVLVVSRNHSFESIWLKCASV